MSYAPEDKQEDPPFLKRLRLMVMVLLVVLILGIVTIAATIVIRLGFAGDVSGRAKPVTAERIALPPGEIVSVGQGNGTVLFVLRRPDGAERLHVFDAQSSKLLSTTDLVRE